MFRIGAALLARGAVAAFVCGFINVAAFSILFALSAGVSSGAWAFLFPGVGFVVLAIILWGALFAPVTMVLLPFAWLAFRRSRHRRLALLGIGFFGGGLWSIKVGIFRGGPYSAEGPLVGGLCGLISSWFFLGLQSSTFVDPTSDRG